MENLFQILIYVLIAYYVFSGSKSKKKVDAVPRKVPQKSLQDILRDIQANATPDSTAQPSTPRPKTWQELLDESSVERSGKDLEEQAEDFGRDIFDRSFASDFESGKKADWGSRIHKKHPKKAEDSDKKMSPKDRPSVFKKVVQNRTSLKQAFILGEIFQRKF